MRDKAGISRFFQNIFLVAETKFEAVLGIFFLKIYNTNMSFDKKILMQRFCISNEILHIIKRVQLVNPKKLIIVMLNTDSEIFIIHMAIQEQVKMLLHSKKHIKV